MFTKATINDLEEISNIESICFPIKEAATKKQIENRIKAYSDYFYILKENSKIISFINGIISNEKDLTDNMYEDTTIHNKNDNWYFIFGVDTHPSYQHKGNAIKLMNYVIEDLKRQNKLGIVLTCKKELITFYEQFGYKNEGISNSTHGDVTWYQMRLTF